MISITSGSNENFKTWKSLLSSKGIKKEKLFILSGEKLVREFLKNQTFKIHAELITKKLSPLVTSLSSNSVFELSSELFNELDELGTHFNLLILELSEIPHWSPEKPFKGIEILCPLGDPSNVGALARSAEAFKATFILTEEAAFPFLPKALKASAGSVLRVPLLKGPSLKSLDQIVLKTCVALDLIGTSILEFKWPDNIRLIVGEEGPGIQNSLSWPVQYKIKIPTENVESLNAVVATSIALFHYQSQKSLDKNQMK